MTLQATVYPVGEEPKQEEPRPARPWIKSVVGCGLIVAIFGAVLAGFWSYRVESYWNEPYVTTVGVVKKVEIYSARRQAYFLATTETDGRVVSFKMSVLPAVGDKLTVYKFGEGEDAYYSINDERTSGSEGGMGTRGELYIFALAAAYGAALTCGWWIGRVRRLSRG